MAVTSFVAAVNVAAYAAVDKAEDAAVGGPAQAPQVRDMADYHHKLLHS